MSIVHLVSSDLHQRPELLQQLLAALAPADVVLLLGQGLYMAARPLPWVQPSYGLHSDAAALALPVPAPVLLLDYPQWVTLSVQHERSLAWH